MSEEKEDKFEFPAFNTEKSSGKLSGKIAKRDHVILQNDFRADIKKGDSLDEIPEKFYETLKTEQII